MEALSASGCFVVVALLKLRPPTATMKHMFRGVPMRKEGENGTPGSEGPDLL